MNVKEEVEAVERGRRRARKNPYMEACWVLPNVVASAMEEAPVDVERYYEKGVLPDQRGHGRFWARRRCLGIVIQRLDGKKVRKRHIK